MALEQATISLEDALVSVDAPSLAAGADGVGLGMSPALAERMARLETEAQRIPAASQSPQPGRSAAAPAEAARPLQVSYNKD